MGKIKSDSQGRKRNPIRISKTIPGGLTMNKHYNYLSILIFLIIGFLPLLFSPVEGLTGPLDHWHLRYSSGNHLNGIAYGNGTFVAVGNAGTILTSLDGGVTWTPQTVSPTNNLNGVTHGANGLFVAVGDQGIIFHSHDGISWDQSNASAFPRTYNLRGVAYGSQGFIAVGDDGTGNALILRSTDGGDPWYAKDDLTIGYWLNAITYGNSRYAVVGAIWLTGPGTPDAGSLMSTDGISWTIRELNLPGSLGIGLNGVAYGNGDFVAVGDGGRIYSSTDGSIYGPRNSGIAQDLWGIAFGNNSFVAVGDGDPIEFLHSRIITSTDLTTWTLRDSGIVNSLNGIAYGGDSTFVAVGVDGIVLQSDPLCTYLISPTSQPIGSGGGSNSVNVTPVDSGCPWVAVSNGPWITITSGSSGMGPGAVNYSVAANPGAARTGTVSIAGQTFTVLQDGDTDGDGIPDSWETTYGLNPNDPSDAGWDLDEDGLTSLQEYQYGTHPNNPDTDGDGVNDGVEVALGTDPLDAGSKPYRVDDFSGEFIDRTIWADLEFVRRIRSGALESELTYYGPTPITNNLGMNLAPTTHNTIQADVTVK